MNDSTQRSRDELLARLLRASGRGPTASPEARERIYAAVHARWRASLDANEGTDPARNDPDSGAAAGTEADAGVTPPVVPSRVRRVPRPRRSRLLPRLALAASVAAAAVIVYRMQQPAPGPAATFASVANVAGDVEVRRDGVTRPAGRGGLGSVRIGDVIATGDEGRVALRLGDGQSLRLNSGTELSVLAASRVELMTGSAYFDSARDSTGAAPGADVLVVDTRFGSVRHAGTQFETSLVSGALRIRVREGAVLFRSDDRELTASAGEQIEIAATGAARRTNIALDDPAWRWIEDLATLAPADEYRLGEVLAWVARETGRELEFGSPAIEARARDVTLFELDGLSPSETLDVIERATAFDYVDGGSVLRVTDPAP